MLRSVLVSSESVIIIAVVRVSVVRKLNVSRERASSVSLIHLGIASKVVACLEYAESVFAGHCTRIFFKDEPQKFICIWNKDGGV